VASSEEHRSADGRESVVQALAKAAAVLLREQPQSALTLRRIALRAGLSHQSVSAQFSCVDALLAEITLARLVQLPLSRDRRKPPWIRVADELQLLLTSMVDEPLLGIACANAVMSIDPVVGRVRTEIETELARRLGAALGYGAWPEVVDFVHWALLGAVVTAVGGAASLTEIRLRIEGGVELLLAR
jgi:AcrR family transcriptional regulator